MVIEIHPDLADNSDLLEVAPVVYKLTASNDAGDFNIEFTITFSHICTTATHTVTVDPSASLEVSVLGGESTLTVTVPADSVTAQGNGSCGDYQVALYEEYGTVDQALLENWIVTYEKDGESLDLKLKVTDNTQESFSDKEITAVITLENHVQPEETFTFDVTVTACVITDITSIDFDVNPISWTNGVTEDESRDFNIAFEPQCNYEPTYKSTLTDAESNESEITADTEPVSFDSSTEPLSLDFAGVDCEDAGTNTVDIEVTVGEMTKTFSVDLEVTVGCECNEISVTDPDEDDQNYVLKFTTVDDFTVTTTFTESLPDCSTYSLTLDPVQGQ